MNKEFYDLEGQKQRQRQIFDLVIDYTKDSFDENGTWVADNWPGGPNLIQRFWFCMVYFEKENPRFTSIANNIIKSSKYYMCAFAPMGALQMLIKYTDKLDSDAVKKLNTYLEDVLDEFKGGSHDFIGVNDNFPAMGTYTALFGGKLFNRNELYEIGVKRLKQFKALLTRRGVDTEFTSPTYTPIHAYAMAEIANYTDDEELKTIALQCEERVWVDILGHYHPSTSQIAGPYSRAYTVDSVGHTHQARYVFYALLGEKLKINPVNTLFVSKKGQDGELIHNGGVTFMQVSDAWLCCTEYHCPAQLVEAMINKQYPFTFKATIEYGPSTDEGGAKPETDLKEQDETYEYPAGTSTISTYMTEDYALGVASKEFHSGVQTDSFHLLYRKKIPAMKQADMATVYSRYIINEKKPGEVNYYPQFDSKCGDSLLWDEGRKLGIQHKNTAMMLYKPKFYGNKSASSLKLSLVFPAHYGTVEEIWLGDKKIDNNHGYSVEPCPVFIKDGPVYMAFNPLILTDYGREYAVKVEQVNEYVTVSFYNYEGEAKDFPKRGFLLTGNGFVSEVGSESEWGSFERFMYKMKEAKTYDELFACEHWRWAYMRRTKYERDGLAIECEYSPVTEGVKQVSVNGKEYDSPKLEITGLNVKELPFIND